MPIIDYTLMRTMVWGIILSQTVRMYKTHACKEFNDSVAEF